MSNPVKVPQLVNCCKRLTIISFFRGWDIEKGDAVNLAVMDTERGGGKEVEVLCGSPPLCSSLLLSFPSTLTVCSAPVIQDED